MIDRYPRQEIIAGLRASGMSDAEIEALIAEELAAHPERLLPAPAARRRCATEYGIGASTTRRSSSAAV